MVWSTVPFTAAVVSSHKDGWLTFESSDMRRRLTPIPHGWDEASPQRLELLLRNAAEVRRTPPTSSHFDEPLSDQP
jgi:hypothetical protein